MGQSVQRAPTENLVHCDRRRPEQKIRYQLVQEHVKTFFAQGEAGFTVVLAARTDTETCG